MGNQASSQSNDEAAKKPKLLVAIDKNNSKDDWFMRDNSSYKGVLSKNSVSSDGQSTAVKERSKDTCEEEQTTVGTINNNKDLNDMKVQVNFEWREEGNVVYLTGNFCNWSQKFLMTKVNNRFVLSLDLLRGVYHFKFIIDGVWKYSKHHSTCNDGKGNVNNIIDATNYPLPVDKIGKILKTDDELIKEKALKKDIFKGETEAYPSQIPAKNDLYVEALLCPSNYQDYFNINHLSNQHLLGKEEFFQKENESVFYDNNNSSRKISVPPHVNLNHLCSAKINHRKGVLYTSMPQRVRNKFCTIIYYKPVN